MLYITCKHLREKDIFKFISDVLVNENKLLNNKSNIKDFTPYLKIISRDTEKIVVACNKNFGLCCYNVFTFDDFYFTSLYPTCKDSYTQEWRNFLNDLYPDYKKDLKYFLEHQDQK